MACFDAEQATAFCRRYFSVIKTAFCRCSKKGLIKKIFVLAAFAFISHFGLFRSEKYFCLKIC